MEQGVSHAEAIFSVKDGPRLPQTASHSLWANLWALGKHSLPDLPAGPSALVSGYCSLHLLSSGKG